VHPPDADLISAADLVVSQPLPQREAAMVAAALDLGEAGEWLGRVRDDMVCVVGRGVVRWARLSASARELQLVGPIRAPVPAGDGAAR
jgi:hypothetical protein